MEDKNVQFGIIHEVGDLDPFRELSEEDNEKVNEQHNNEKEENK